MLHLQERAHLSLEEFRQGKSSPLNRYGSSFAPEPATPVDENDELAILGGKTRLVAKKEPSSPQLMQRSPNSGDPIVPLPLSPTLGQVHPNVVEYLQSFRSQDLHGIHQSNLQQLHSATTTGSFSDVDLSPVSMYGMSSIPSPSYQTEPSSFLPKTLSQQLQSQNMGLQNHNQHQSSSSSSLQMMDTSTNGSSFPQYFPVYDYGSGGMSNGNSYGPTPLLDSSPVPGQKRTSGSPEANMQTTWQDFVNTLAM